MLPVIAYNLLKSIPYKEDIKKLSRSRLPQELIHFYERKWVKPSGRCAGKTPYSRFGDGRAVLRSGHDRHEATVKKSSVMPPRCVTSVPEGRHQ